MLSNVAENVDFELLHKPNTYMGLTDEHYVICEDDVYQLCFWSNPEYFQPLQSTTFSAVVREAFEYINA